MPVKKKDLYVAKSLKALHDLAALPANMTTNPNILINSAKSIHKQAELNESLGDDEKAYILYMKYFNVVTLARKLPDYKKQKDYYDSLIRQKIFLKSIDKREELSASLKDRYELAEAEEVASKLSPLEDKSAPKEEPVKTPETEKQSEEKKTDGPVWLLVVFLEEDVLSPPILLGEVQDLIGRNGVEADLQEGNRCVVRDYVGDQMHAALVYKRSENPEELIKEYERIEMMKQKPKEERQFPHKSQGLPTRTRNNLDDNQTSRNPSFAESRKTADSLANIYQYNNIPTSQKKSCSSLDSTDQNQDEEYLSAVIQHISLNADEAEQLYRQNQQLQEEKQCKICLDSEMDTLFEPCGHLCTCRSCASMLQMCPICRKQIKKLHRVYRS
uniref:RING-type domain-containing protein n=2 Tax=Magallana gigas TaxID=29159 RepID=A0A8W8P0C2_MAGGI|nr:kinesin-like protein KIN-7M, chloroplastic isoform X1 [Crassostrea gigas]XP_034319483.1 kinesin-like protein KIN-7M, chloroplastic isoform X1 [Crassostrea gigas]XP_034319484.1 kinesin-like protein KIN-7M, chloroplastic isoform X1 [Crassostrea gigas]XP_034319485.1 kinesin-like protein KIN-7M, chloroplastic isoform X1 [Crassostrea gigas]XP_034319486.1 kinesin-like protein KIN-7M, chloroplastic isoform X1 [Crassostrea gigas]XP_034319488.1 kinesin-like protein KIN-7M, chloroplastic isoform X1 [